MPAIQHTNFFSRVSKILRDLGLSDKSLEPVESHSNMVWLTRDHVIQYHVIGPVGRLEHEARVAARLPAGALYPKIVAVGRDGEHDWLVTKRVQGVPICAVWPRLSTLERRDAVRQIAVALRVVHSSAVTDLIPPCLQRGEPVQSRGELVHRLRTLRIPPSFSSLLEYRDGPTVMAHGDFSFNQVIWHEGRVTALLDLEMSHAEAPDWDLVTLLEFCHDPVRALPSHLEAISNQDDYAEVPGWLREAYPEMFTFPRMQDRFTLYALVLRHTELATAGDHVEEIIEASADWARALAGLLP